MTKCHSRRFSRLLFGLPLVPLLLGACDDRQLSTGVQEPTRPEEPHFAGGRLSERIAPLPAASDRDGKGIVPPSLPPGAASSGASSLTRSSPPGGPSHIVWQNAATGQRVIWHMSGPQWNCCTAQNELLTIPTEWSIVASADFTGDGTSDLVWQRRSTGDQVIWHMDGFSWQGIQTPLPQVHPDWWIVAAGDFSGDGKPDLVWQNRKLGRQVIWHMDGTRWRGSQNELPRVSPEWWIVGAGDFTGDARPDLLWQNRGVGRQVIWHMNGTTWGGSQNELLPVSPEWHIAGAGDFNADGKADILWQNRDHGRQVLWFMDRTQWNWSQAELMQVPAEWRIATILAVPSTAGASPIIHSVTPGTLVAGSSATIVGENLVRGSSATTVRVGGVEAVVTSASATQLTVQLPSASSFACAPTRPSEVTVTAGGLTTSRPHPLAVARQIALQVGELLAGLTPEQARCAEIVEPSGRYVLSVVNGSSVATAIAPFQLRATVPGAVMQPPRASASRAAKTSLDPAAKRSPLPTVPGRRGHLRRMEQDRRFLRAQGAALLRRLPRPQSASRAAVPSATVPSVGAMLPFRYRSDGGGPACQRYLSITARVAYVGQRAIIVEDAEAPLAGQMDDFYRWIGDEFDTRMFPLLERSFGNPLAMDSRLDQDGRVYLFFTPQVNDDGAAGFGPICDFFSQSDLAASNEADVLYLSVPLEQADVDWYRQYMPATVMHEAHHLTVDAERIARSKGGDISWEASWLAEGTANVAMEMYYREICGFRWKGNGDAEQLHACERRMRAAGTPVTIFAHFLDVYDYYASVETTSPIVGNWSDAPFYYSSAWSLVRWAADQSPDEARFFADLAQDVSVTGVANLEKRAGRPLPAILSEWSLSLALDDAAGSYPATLRQPGWHTPSMLREVRRLWQLTDGDDPLVIRRRSFGSFVEDVSTIHGGGLSLFELSGSAGAAQLLELLGPGGAPPAPTLRFSIVRVE